MKALDKKIRIAALLLFFLPIWVQSQSTVTLRCELSACPGGLGLYTFDGFMFRQVNRLASLPEGQAYEFKVPASPSRFYYVGPMAEQTRPIILGEEKLVVLKGNCGQIPNAEITGSPINQDYAVLQQKIGVLSNRSGQLMRSFAYAQDDAQRNTFQEQMKALDTEKLLLLDSLRKANPFFFRIAALSTYLSFPNNNKGRYPSEVDYFAGEFFNFADFSDKGYDNLPWLFEAFNSYTQTLTSVNLDKATMGGHLKSVLAKFPQGSAAQEMAYAGMLNALMERKHELYPDVAQDFIQQFNAKNPEAVASIKSGLEQAMRLMVGSVAPDFSQQTPDGKMLKLSDLRGKYVLIDFWASWCGPCRRENPNVVRMYERYKAKGFEILGVSLDQNRERWLDAIAADGLKWPQVSDLKGWANAVAQNYEVSSIPKTILVDPKGVIVAKDLRGQTLESMLSQLFK